MGKLGQSSNKESKQMPIGTIDFSNVTDNFKPLPAGEYEGQTAGWEAKPSNDGESTNIFAKFKLSYQDEEGNDRTRTHRECYNLKEAALWRFKRDMISLGADPEVFAGEVDIEAIMNDLFGQVPTPVTATLEVSSYERTNRTTGQREDVPTNNMTKVERLA